LITMRFQQEDRALRIIVEDNGTDLSESKLSALQKLLNDTSNIETSGLINIHRRLRLIYGDEHGLFLERSAMGGLKVTLQLDPKASV
jgi:two-component system, sensor histidine kinase YesM